LQGRPSIAGPAQAGAHLGAALERLLRDELGADKVEVGKARGRLGEERAVDHERVRRLERAPHRRAQALDREEADVAEKAGI
jgi:hypothetical protein